MKFILTCFVRDGVMMKNTFPKMRFRLKLIISIFLSLLNFPLYLNIYLRTKWLWFFVMDQVIVLCILISIQCGSISWSMVCKLPSVSHAVQFLTQVCGGSAFGNGEIASFDFPYNAWEAFHKNHSKALFFKERRYLVKEFPELLSATYPTARILEVGCGTGSSVVPILRANEEVKVYGCDCSPFALQRAIEVVIQKAADFGEPQIQRFRPFLCDISSATLPSWLCCSTCRDPKQQLLEMQGELSDEEQLIGSTSLEISSSQVCGRPPRQHCLGGVNIATLIFTLSSIPPANMQHVMTEIASVLQPGGWLLFRDYGLYDLTMLRFPPSQKISDRLYHRKDGTLSYFFSLEFVRDLFTKVGLVEDELHYCCVQLRNRRTQLLMKRVWVHAKFRKPGDLNLCSFSGAERSPTSCHSGNYINAEL